MKSFLLVFLLALGIGSNVSAQMAPQPQAVLTLGAGDTLNMDWEGLAARSYFIQYSEDLQKWNYFPVVELGNGDPIGYGFSSTANKFFVRLKYTDEPTNDAEQADFDGDGLVNIDEVTIYHTDPFLLDTDGDGMPDGYEIENSLDPKDNGSINPLNGAWGDKDGDKTANIEEMLAKTDPNSNLSFPPMVVDVWRTGSARVERHPNDAEGGEYSPYASWTGTWTTIEDTSELTPATVEQRLSAGFPFPNQPPQQDSQAIRLPLSGGYISSPVANYANYSTQDDTYESGYLQQRRIWISAPAKQTAQSFKLLKRERFTSQAMSSANNTTGPVTETNGAATVETLIIPANSTFSSPLDLLPTGQMSSGTFHQSYMYASQVSIVPDAGMAGVVGDMIPSNKTTDPELHFVSPKKTTEIPNDYVVLKAVGLNADEIDPASPHQIVEWDGGGEAVPGEPLKWQVKRDNAGLAPIGLKLKSTGELLAKVNVWIVWATMGAPTTYGAASFVNSGGAGSYNMDNVFAAKFVFSIQPYSQNGADLFSATADRPALEGAAEKGAKQVPGADKPHPLKSGNYVNKKADAADFKWDVSRQMEIKILNPNGFTKSEFTGPPVFFANQRNGSNEPLVPADTPIPFPSNPVEGNDDATLSSPDEDDNPYQVVSGPYAHTIGRICSSDSPKSPVWLNRVSTNGARYCEVTNFREFARLQLWDGVRTTGNFWFRISDYGEWHFTVDSIYDTNDLKWKDNPNSPSSHGAGIDTRQ